MKRNIEEAIQPETLNELLMFRRIMELKRELHNAGVFDEPIFNLNSGSPMEFRGSALPPVLRLGVQLAAEKKLTGVSIEARAYGEKGFGIGQYLTEDLIQRHALDHGRFIHHHLREFETKLVDFLYRDLQS